MQMGVSNGNDVTLLVTACDSVSGSSSLISLRIASTSTMRVWSSSSVMDNLPSVFFRVVFVNPTRCSPKPPYQGARFGISFHWTPCLLKASCSDGDSSNSFRISAEVGGSVIRYHNKG